MRRPDIVTFPGQEAIARTFQSTMDRRRFIAKIAQGAATIAGLAKFATDPDCGDNPLPAETPPTYKSFSLEDFIAQQKQLIKSGEKVKVTFPVSGKFGERNSNFVLFGTTRIEIHVGPGHDSLGAIVGNITMQTGSSKAKFLWYAVDDNDSNTVSDTIKAKKGKTVTSVILSGGFINLDSPNVYPDYDPKIAYANIFRIGQISVT